MTGQFLDLIQNEVFIILSVDFNCVMNGFDCTTSVLKRLSQHQNPLSKLVLCNYCCCHEHVPKRLPVTWGLVFLVELHAVALMFCSLLENATTCRVFL